jgi:ABC-2 type transport system permease protein
MRGLKDLMWVQFKLYLREPAAFFFTLAFPTLLLLLFGAIYGNRPAPAFWGRPVGTVDASVPAYIGLIIGTVALMNIPADTATNRDSGALRRFRATPLRPLTYLAASIGVYLLLALSGTAILVIVGKVVFDLKMGGSWPAVLLGFTLSALAFFAFGYVLASVARTPRTAQTLGMVIFFPMMFLSGAGMPVQMLPARLQEFSNLLPLTYVVRLMQGLWYGDGLSHLIVPGAVLLGLLALGAVMAARLFKWE